MGVQDKGVVMSRYTDTSDEEYADRGDDRPGLDARSRQLVTLGALTALGGCEPQLRVHIGAALNVGITREEIVEALLHSAVYAGFPRALNATFAAREVFAERDREAGAATAVPERE